MVYRAEEPTSMQLNSITAQNWRLQPPLTAPSPLPKPIKAWGFTVRRRRCERATERFHAENRGVKERHPSHRPHLPTSRV